MLTDTSKTKSQTITVEAFYFGEYIDLKKIQENLKHWNFLNKDHPLIIKVEENKFVALTKFGVLAFWDIDENYRKQILEELFSFIRSKQNVYRYTEKLYVTIGAEQDQVSGSQVQLKELSTDRIKLISYALAQSVALERYEDEIESSLKEAGKNIDSLKIKGRIAVTSLKLLKQIGQAMSVKQVAVAHLSLFDKPEEAWESFELEKLYTTLQADFELVDRFDVLNEKIHFLSENTRMLIDLVGERRMYVLELIIVIFFAIDLVLLLFGIFK